MGVAWDDGLVGKHLSWKYDLIMYLLRSQFELHQGWFAFKMVSENSWKFIIVLLYQNKISYCKTYVYINKKYPSK